MCACRTLDVFHSAGNMDVELRLGAVSSNYSFSCGCPRSANNTKPFDRVRLQDIRDA